jgi:hypothetical protein
MKAKIIFLSFFILTLGLVSCSKEDDISNPTTNRPESIKELTATADFSWQTVRNVKVTIQGSHIMTTTIKTANGNEFFKGMVKPNAKVETTIALPSTINEILVSYGPFTRVVKIVNNTIECNFDLNKF